MTLEEYVQIDFQTFRNILHHKLKNLGELGVLLEIIETKQIDYYYDNNDILKALYLLSFVDHLSKKNNIPLCKEYSNLRFKKLEKPYYVGDVSMFKEPTNAISEFVVHNIYEGELYDSV